MRWMLLLVSNVWMSWNWSIEELSAFETCLKSISKYLSMNIGVVVVAAAAISLSLSLCVCVCVCVCVLGWGGGSIDFELPIRTAEQ